MFRVRVVRADGVYIGSIPAQVGMVDVSGSKIDKVNAKTVLTERETRLDYFEIYWFEAERFGFPDAEGVELSKNSRAYFHKEDAFHNGQELFKEKQPKPPESSVLMCLGWEAAQQMQMLEDLYLKTAIALHDKQEPKGESNDE